MLNLFFKPLRWMVQACWHYSRQRFGRSYECFSWRDRRHHVDISQVAFDIFVVSLCLLLGITVAVM